MYIPSMCLQTGLSMQQLSSFMSCIYLMQRHKPVYVAGRIAATPQIATFEILSLAVQYYSGSVRRINRGLPWEENFLLRYQTVINWQ